MADIVDWPSNVPTGVNTSGFALQKGDATIRSEVDVGPQKVRRRSTSPIDTFTVSIDMSSDEVLALEEFFDVDLNGGVNQFRFINPISEVEEIFRMKDPRAPTSGIWRHTLDRFDELGALAVSNQLTPQLLAQIFAQESNDPFLTLLTLTHDDFDPIYLVNNSENITSRGIEFQAFPFKIKLPADDGETSREVSIEFDNVSLELIEAIRTVTTSIDVKLEMILASMPDVVQMSIDDLKITTINYNKSRVSAKLFLDTFLTTELTSERYLPANFPGLF